MAIVFLKSLQENNAKCTILTIYIVHDWTTASLLSYKMINYKKLITIFRIGCVFIFIAYQSASRHLALPRFVKVLVGLEPTRHCKY